MSVPAIFPVDRWQWGDVTVLSDRFLMALAILVMTVLLTMAYRWTRFGLLTRAVAETPTGATVSGVSPERIALLNWMAGAVVAGAGGILIAPIVSLTPDSYALAVIPALAACVIGRFTLMIPAAAAGIAIGMLQSEASTLSAQHSWLPQTGFSELIPLLVILVALLVTGRGDPVVAEASCNSASAGPRAHDRPWCRCCSAPRRAWSRSW